MNADIYVVVEHLRGQVAGISYTALAAAREMAGGTGGSVAAVLLGHNAGGLAEDLGADCRLYVDHPALADYTLDAYAEVLAQLIGSSLPRAVLFGDTSIGAELAGVLSMRLGLPLVSHCLKLSPADGTLRFTSQICGGKILAEGALPDATTLITLVPGGFKPEQGRRLQNLPLERVTPPALDSLRIALTGYLEPEAGDVDITQAPVLIAVGRGIENPDNLEMVEELAGALGGVVCASRPVVDQGWLPASRLVGKSGKTVKPTVYLALGISGAPEHVEGMADSQMIIAVNTDPRAPIFDVARYGAEIDLLDLLPVLTDRVRAARGG